MSFFRRAKRAPATPLVSGLWPDSNCCTTSMSEIAHLASRKWAQSDPTVSPAVHRPTMFDPRIGEWSDIHPQPYIFEPLSQTVTHCHVPIYPKQIILSSLIKKLGNWYPGALYHIPRYIPAFALSINSNDMYLFGNDDAGDALFDAAFPKILIQRCLRLLLVPATNSGKKSRVQRQYRPPNQRNIAWDYHSGTVCRRRKVWTSFAPQWMLPSWWRSTQSHYYTIPS